MLNNDEKLGGNMIEPNITTSFRNTLTLCDLQDLGFTGSRYTWTNNHPGDQLILARLDRFLTNSDWIQKYSNYNNTHLLIFKSDHCPILLNFSNDLPHRSNKQTQRMLRFQQVWTRNDQHVMKVKEAWSTTQGHLTSNLSRTLDHLHSWGQNLFGTLPRKIKQIQEELLSLNQRHGTMDLSNQIKDKEAELDNLLEGEEMWWRQRSRADWLQHGDKNTSFFHKKASQRKKRNKITHIKDTQDQIWREQEDIERVMMEHFKTLFQRQDTHHIDSTVGVVKNKINQDMFDHLSAKFTEIEVYNAIRDMKSLAAPGPDGLPALFYHTYWDTIGKDVISAVLNIPNNNGDPSLFNHTHICLIPKIPNPTYASDFRPIALCNVTLKIITKIVANRLKTIFPNIVSQNQSAFVQGRLITDNSIIAHEIFHFFSHSSSKKGYVGIKTDMAKAYDRVEWDFLKATLDSMGFPHNIISIIMKCVPSVTFAILINGIPAQTFSPQRGLRQGDPLSPYLFILCADVLSGLISNAQMEKCIKGVKVAHGAPEITHLFFSDDSLLFCRANKEEVTHLKNIITTYQEASGQLVNVNKSEILFSRHVREDIRDSNHHILPM
jgi:hypothetical protein